MIRKGTAKTIFANKTVDMRVIVDIEVIAFCVHCNNTVHQTNLHNWANAVNVTDILQCYY